MKSPSSEVKMAEYTRSEFFFQPENSQNLGREASFGSFFSYWTETDRELGSFVGGGGKIDIAKKKITQEAST